MSNEPSLASVIMIMTCLHNVRSSIAASAKITLSLRLRLDECSGGLGKLDSGSIREI